jgi:hypothetical protein
LASSQKIFFEREPRVLIGYNYFPDFPLAFELGHLKNGLGVILEWGQNQGIGIIITYLDILVKQ